MLFGLLVPDLNRMQVSTWPGGQSVLSHGSTLIQRLCQVCYVVSGQNQYIQLGELGVRWD